MDEEVIDYDSEQYRCCPDEWIKLLKYYGINDKKLSQILPLHPSAHYFTDQKLTQIPLGDKNLAALYDSVPGFKNKYSDSELKLEKLEEVNRHLQYSLRDMLILRSDKSNNRTKYDIIEHRRLFLSPLNYKDERRDAKDSDKYSDDNNRDDNTLDKDNMDNINEEYEKQNETDDFNKIIGTDFAVCLSMLAKISQRMIEYLCGQDQGFVKCIQRYGPNITTVINQCRLIQEFNNVLNLKYSWNRARFEDSTVLGLETIIQKYRFRLEQAFDLELDSANDPSTAMYTINLIYWFWSGVYFVPSVKYTINKKAIQSRVWHTVSLPPAVDKITNIYLSTLI